MTLYRLRILQFEVVFWYRSKSPQVIKSHPADQSHPRRRYQSCLKYNSNFACNLSENCLLQLCAFLTAHSQKKTYWFRFLPQILSCYNLKISFSKLVKVVVLVLEYIFQYQYSYSKFFAVLILVLGS